MKNDEKNSGLQAIIDALVVREDCIQAELREDDGDEFVVAVFSREADEIDHILVVWPIQIQSAQALRLVHLNAWFVPEGFNPPIFCNVLNRSLKVGRCEQGLEHEGLVKYYLEQFTDASALPLSLLNRCVDQALGIRAYCNSIRDQVVAARLKRKTRGGSSGGSDLSRN